MPSAAFISEAKSLKAWTIDKALPFWAENAIDDRGGFYEDLTLGGTPNKDAIRRIRVQARQIFVYANAAHLAWYPQGKNIAVKTFNFMKDVGYQPDTAPGFAHLINADYSVNNPKRVLYDHAFYLLACSALLQLEDGLIQKQAKALCDDIFTFLSTSLISTHGGWDESLPSTLPRRQNPHMHMLETAMALYDATQNDTYLDIARDIYALFERYFFDPSHNIIGEFFNDDWSRAAGEKGQSAEPGHAAEWVWLLWQYERRTGTDTSQYANALYGNAFKNNDVFLNDEENANGYPLRETKRLWVQTEVIRAHLAQMERGNIQAEDKAVKAMAHFKNIYLDERGTWTDQIDANGKACAQTIPTSTFYHIFGMVTEAARLANIL